jgi:GNAT superfamily N-acetyltransferase
VSDSVPPAACAPYDIRTAQLEDAVEIARLAGVLGYPNETVAMRARLASVQQLPGHWVAVVSSEVPAALCGWLHVARCTTLETGEFAEILGLVVDGSARRGGLGRQLVVRAKRWGREQGLTRITVRSNAARVESHPFYAALGYRRLKTQQVYVKALENAGSD